MKKQTLSKTVTPVMALLCLSLAIAPARAASKAPDLDGDGIPNIVDPDIDNDGIPNALDKNVDGGVAKTGPYAGKYIGDHLDNDNPSEDDIDGDGQKDDSLAEKDIDGDGRLDDSPLEDDIDGDRRRNNAAAERDIDGDGVNDDDAMEDDIDGDGLSDDEIAEGDIDGDGISDDMDDDIDGDGRANADIAEDDTDGDGLKNDDAAETNDDGDSLDDRMDPDDDNDGIADEDDSDHHREDDEQEVEVSLSRLAAPSGSRAIVKISQLATGKIDLELEGRDFPAGAYTVIIGGTARGTLTMVSSGSHIEGEIQWETNPNQATELPLDFTAIGQPVSLEKTGVIFFTGTIPTPPLPSGTTPLSISAAATLIPARDAPSAATGNLWVTFGRDGARDLDLVVDHLAPGQYDLYIGALLRANLTIAGSAGAIRFCTPADSAAGELPLDFAPSGLPLVLKLGETTIFTSTVPAAPPGIADGGGDDDHGSSTAFSANLQTTASAPATARAEVKIKFGLAGATSLEIEARHLAAGTYEVLIGQTVRGLLTITGDEAYLKFASAPDDAGEILFDFAAAGLPVVIRQGGTILLTGTIPVRPV